jgi:general stress protein CsbA
MYKFLSILYYLGMALLFAGIIMMMTDMSGGLIVFSAGTLPIVGIRLFNRIVARPERQRINTILFISSLFLAGAAAAKYYDEKYWVVFILITAVLDFYVSFRRIN